MSLLIHLLAHEYSIFYVFSRFYVLPICPAPLWQYYEHFYHLHLCITDLQTYLHLFLSFWKIYQNYLPGFEIALIFSLVP